jgi:hypothetical protein
MKNAGKFYGHLEYFRVIWFISWPFGNVVVIWYISPHFGTLCQEKSGNPAVRVDRGVGGVTQSFKVTKSICCCGAGRPDWAIFSLIGRFFRLLGDFFASWAIFFVYRVIVYFGQFFKNYRSGP